MKTFIRRRWYGIVLLLAVAGVILEKTYVVKRETAKEILSFSGEVDAMEKVTLQFQTSGKLAWTGVKEGDRVAKWQALAGLDITDAYKNLQKILRDYSISSPQS